ncbi:lamin tail domain-containing protein [Streptomyces sp. NBC_01803]|uniref:lamin tail domain-containing protein n=1 Tax=Streptomyces sp. NBC_01803 TaxID=2975946 RepID=UPI002DDC019F|nr:lamin tail domain-containing protein [Streptomyces sp. NBC_01803]WSA43007.1 lamin tail domain-containing protein [Streptomyces sp. NBC_01803]
MATVVTTGTWVLPKVNASQFTVNNEHITWGAVADSVKSGYVFQGGPVPVRVDGTEFVLGTFTHHNFPIPPLPQDQFDVRLAVNVAFEEGTEIDFVLRFHHNETPNQGPRPEDLVDLPVVHPQQEVVTVDGAAYNVLITGFWQNHKHVHQFVSPEGKSNSADIYALLTPVPVKPILHISRVEAIGNASTGQSDEFVEILNRGAEPANISGWTLSADDAGQDFTFPPGTALEPGRRIRVHTNEVRPEDGGHSFGIGRPIWNNEGDTARLRDTNGNAVSVFAYGDHDPTASGK